MRVAMIGLGRLGAPVSIAMVKMGHEVYGYDVDLNKSTAYRAGKCDLYEPDIEAELRWALANGFHVMTTVKGAVEPAEIVFVAVPTPSLDDDSFDTGYVAQAVYEIAEAMKDCLDYKVVAIISTVLPGTVRREFLPILTEELGQPGPQTFGLVYNAQFIAMGTTMRDMLEPEFVLIGQYDDLSGDKLGAFYSSLTDAPLLRMSIESAEMVKMSYNTMIGFKIVYANTLMELCDKIPQADCDTVTHAICLATKRLLSCRYLRGGMGDGGGCLPPGEVVITKDGPRAIETISPGDEVLTVDGTLQPVLGRWERSYDGELINVPVRGLPGATLTADHRMIVARDGRKRSPKGQRNTNHTILEKMGDVEEKQARFLDGDDLIPLPIPIEQIGLTVDVQKWNHISSGYIELAGWYLSEGWAICTRRRGRIGFALHEDEIEIACRIGELCVRLDPPAESGRRQDVKVSISRKDGSKGISVRYGSKELAQHLIEDFGSGAQDKKIPDWIVYGPLEWARLLMKRLWQGDGHTCESGMSLSTISCNLAWSTLLILSRLGIPATLREIKPRTGKNGQHHKRAYEVRVRNKAYIETMASTTGLEDKTKEQPKLYSLYPRRDGSFWRHVTEQSCRSYRGKVYNLWVAGNNTYVTGCGAVHNCHPRDNRALSYLADELCLSADPFHFVMEARDLQTEYIASVVDDIARRTELPVAMMGRTFKPETNLEIDSPALLLGQYLTDMGHVIRWYDPITLPDPLPDGPHLYVVATAHKQFINYPYWRDSVIVDPWRIVPDVPGCVVRRIGGGEAKGWHWS